MTDSAIILINSVQGRFSKTHNNNEQQSLSFDETDVNSRQNCEINSRCIGREI